VGVAEGLGVSGVDDTDADGLEVAAGGTEPSAVQPLTPIPSATEAVATMLRRRRPKIMSLP
jgi:hypothetical protein